MIIPVLQANIQNFQKIIQRQLRLRPSGPAAIVSIQDGTIMVPYVTRTFSIRPPIFSC